MAPGVADPRFLVARAFTARAAPRATPAANLLLAALLLQLALGIATLLLVVPVPLAAAHQAGAVLLFAAALNAAHALRSRASTESTRMSKRERQERICIPPLQGGS